MNDTYLIMHSIWMKHDTPITRTRANHHKQYRNKNDKRERYQINRLDLLITSYWKKIYM